LSGTLNSGNGGYVIEWGDRNGDLTNGFGKGLLSGIGVRGYGLDGMYVYG
jgi:hypothetical protein